jgi:hypothetical protein
MQLIVVIVQGWALVNMLMYLWKEENFLTSPVTLMFSKNIFCGDNNRRNEVLTSNMD